MVSCDLSNFGCSGGYLSNSIDHLFNEGVTTDQCFPYLDKDSKCTYRKCSDSREEYKKYYCKPGTLVLAPHPLQIQKELMNNGPMMVGLTVYEDFLSYASGIYEYTAG